MCRPSSLGLTALLAALAALAACDDLRQFSGDWRGTLSDDPNHQHGMTPGAAMAAKVGTVGRYAIDLQVLLPGRTEATRFEAIRHAADDVLGDVRLHGDPLRTYFGFLRPATGEPYLTVVSLYSEDRIEVRLIRGPEETYAVFYLRRLRPGAAGGDAAPGN
jgi:hypothetical protein